MLYNYITIICMIQQADGGGREGGREGVGRALTGVSPTGIFRDGTKVRGRECAWRSLTGVPPTGTPRGGAKVRGRKGVWRSFTGVPPTGTPRDGTKGWRRNRRGSAGGSSRAGTAFGVFVRAGSGVESATSILCFIYIEIQVL